MKSIITLILILFTYKSFAEGAVGIEGGLGIMDFGAEILLKQ